LVGQAPHSAYTGNVEGREMIRTLLMASTLLLACCGPNALTLPDEPVDQAATCGVIAAQSARLATHDIQATLPFEAMGRIIHYPLLAGSTGGSFSSEVAGQVQTRMTELQDGISEGKWQELIPACRTAFPATAVGQVELPADRFDAQLGCVELGDFLRSALEDQAEYANELGEYRNLGMKLEASLARGLHSRAGSDPGARMEERRKALATFAKAGPPVAVLRECLTRFG
jgi:hypothetical protein